MISAIDADLSCRVALGVGAAIAGIFAISRWHYRAIPSLRPTRPRAAPPDCMVVIPARNEELFIARAVASFPHDSVIVVDDNSGDRTAEAAQKEGAGVIPAPDLPSGAIGKANACLAGARVLTSKWILFADADTCFAPGFLDAAVACAEASSVAFLSMHLSAEVRGVRERLLVPYAQALYYCAVSPWGDPLALFNGQCILVLREAYEFLGGHAAVMNSLVDDVKIAALARRHRLKFATARAGSLGRVRFRNVGASFHRAAFRFLLVNFSIGAAILLAATAIALWLPVLAWLLADRHFAGAAIFALLPIAGALPWYRNFWSALFSPLAIYAMLPVLFKGAFAALVGRSVEWKGRFV